MCYSVTLNMSKSFAEKCMDELHEIMIDFKFDTKTEPTTLLLNTMRKIKNLNNKYTQHICNSLSQTIIKEERK